MPGAFTVPYARNNATLSQLILEQGRQQAEAAARRGEITGQAWSNVGNVIAGTLKDIALQKQQAPIIAAEQKARELQNEATGLQIAGATRQVSEDAALRQLFSREQPPAPEEIYQIVGPQRGAEIVKGLAALQAQNQAAYKGSHEIVRDVLLGMNALPEGVRAEAYPTVRQNLVQRGIIGEQDAPAQYDAGWFQSAMRFGQEPAKPFAVAPGGSVLKETPEGQVQPIFTAPNPEAESRAADRAADNARADAAARATEAYRNRSLAIEQQNADTQRMNAETTRKRYSGLGVDTEIPTEYRTPLERAIMSVPQVRRGSVANLANRLWTEGKTDELKSVIQQAAIESENVDLKNQVMGRQATIAALHDVRSMIADLKREGVPTNILSGTLEDVARKLGTTRNTRYVELANRMMDTLINYRRAATGVQFSEKESADYAKMFPNYKNTLPVNEALINGMIRGMETNDRVYWDRKLGKAGADLVLGRGGDASGGYSITAPNGKTYTFESQDKLDAFKRDAGIK